MPIIRRRFNYGNVLLNPEIVSAKFCAAGRNLDALLKGGGIELLYFKGFIEVSTLANPVAPVKLVNISAYSTESDPHFSTWTHYCQYTVLLGQRVSDGVYLCIDSQTQFPIAWCEINRGPNQSFAPR